MLFVPPLPDVPAAQRGQGAVHLRYEDVAQDGRLRLAAMPASLGIAWRELVAPHPLSAALADQGIRPILTRLYAAGQPVAVSVMRRLRADAGLHLAHVPGEDGAVRRILMNLWVDLAGQEGGTYAPAPPPEAPHVPVGRVFALHVFSRLFAPPGQRRVLRFEAEGLDPVPPAVFPWRPPAEAMALPEGATPLDPALAPDVAPIRFGLTHTDSNQHVNSLVYPQLFEEAALRRFAARGRSTAILGSEMELAYRKPSFAGDALRLGLRAFEWQGQLGAVGCFAEEADLAEPAALPERARVFARMLFR